MVYEIVPETLPVSVDIKPGSCSNLVNFKSNAVLPVAVLGSDEFDVNMIDPASIRLNDAAPIGNGFEDVGCPSSGIDYEVYTVLNEVHIFNDPFPFILNQAYAEPASIVVMDITRTLIYTEGDDYLVYINGDHVEIAPRVFGFEFPKIADGQTLSVDYVYYVENESAPCEACSDGFTDLILRFKTRAVVETLRDVQREDVVTLSLTGLLYDGTPIEGIDSVIVKGGPKKKPKPHKK
jgi:hypothetical protein